jgi:hypothetical protein
MSVDRIIPEGGIMKTEATVITGANDKAGGILMNQERVIAYFSMDIALEPDIPTYSGGLGALAGDTVRSAADYGSCLKKKSRTKKSFAGGLDDVYSPVFNIIVLDIFYLHFCRCLFTWHQTGIEG